MKSKSIPKFFLNYGTKQLGGIVVLFWALYLVVFVPFPLRGSLTGDLDTWCNLSLYKELWNAILDIFRGSQSGVSNYPCDHPWVYFGLNFFAGFLFIPFKCLQLPDLWAYYFFITLLLALNSAAIYKLCTLYVSQSTLCFFSGVFFSLSNFMLGNIDNPNTIALFPGILGLYYLMKAVKFPVLSNWKWFLICFAFQLLIGTVPCVIFLIAYLIIIGLNWKVMVGKIGNIPVLIPACILLLIVSSPWIYFYGVLNVCSRNFNAVRGIPMAQYLSMGLNDFSRVLPNNLLFQFKDEYYCLWVSLFKCGYPGISILITALVGVLALGFERKEPFFFLMIGLFLCLGPIVTYHSQELFKSPLFLLYLKFPVYDFFRVPARAYFLGSIGLVILFCKGWSVLISSDQKVLQVFALVIPFFVIIENVPFPFLKYNSNNILNPSSQYLESINHPEIKTVLNLPSSLFTGYYTDQREYWYTYWQTIHRKNSINGFLAYLTPQRLSNDSLCKHISDSKSLYLLLKRNDIDVVVFHKYFCWRGEETDQLNSLLKSPLLQLESTQNDQYIFRVNKLSLTKQDF